MSNSKDQKFHIPFPDIAENRMFPHTLTLILVALFGLGMLKLETINYNVPMELAGFLKFQLTVVLESAVVIGIGIMLIEKFISGKSIIIAFAMGAVLSYLLGTPAYTRNAAIVAAGIVLSKYAKKEGLLDKKDISQSDDSYLAKEKAAAEFKQEKAVSREAEKEERKK